MLIYKQQTNEVTPQPQIMERLPRYFVKGHAQHVIQRGNNRDVIFVSDEDYRFYLECLTEAAGGCQGVAASRPRVPPGPLYNINLAI